MSASKVFIPSRGLGYVSNHLPLQVRYIKTRKENLIVTCVGKSFHTYGISHFGLLSVGSLHHEDITCMASDVYHIYTACDKVIYAWRRGTELQHTFRGHRKKIHLMLSFGPHLISVDEGSAIKVWDIKGECVFLDLAFSNAKFKITALVHPATYINKLLFASEQGQMQLWNLNTVKLIYTFKGWGSGVTCMEQAPAIDVIAVGLDNGKIVLHNIKYDESIMDFTQDWGPIVTISFRTDGHPIMATGSTVGNIVFWDLDERKVSSQLLSAHDDSVTGMTCLPNEPLVITSSPDNTLKLWIFDMPDGGARLLRIREGHSASPSYIRFHGSNGHNILSASTDSTLRIFNTQTEQFNKSLGKASYNRKISKKKGKHASSSLIMPPIVEFTSETTREKEWDNIAAVHSGLPLVTTWSYDKIKMGELKLLPERLHHKNRNHDSDCSATCIAITHCGNFVIIGYNTGHIDRFNIQSGIWRDNYGSPAAHEYPIRGVAVDGLNKRVISGCGDGYIRFWSFKNNGREFYKELNLSEPIRFFRTHHESSMLAIALEDFSIQILDIDTHRIVRHFIGHTAQINDATFSPDSRWLITSSMDCSIRTWDIPSAQLIDQFRTETACISLTMSPTGEAIATAHVDYLGLFLWTNRTIYTRVTLRALDVTEEPQLVALPECCQTETTATDDSEVTLTDNDTFLSPEQIHKELLTLSGLSTSRWLNLLNIDVIRKRNKPKAPPKAPKAAPFFLPTIPSLNFQFDLEKNTNDPETKILTNQTITNFTEFGKLLAQSTSGEFISVIDKLKGLGPSGIEFEIKSLCPEGGGSVEVMLQFFKCVESMLKSNRDFELAQAYLAVFLKAHGNLIAEESDLRNYLPNIQSCLSVGWNRIQEKLFYNMCIVENIKTM